LHLTLDNLDPLSIDIIDQIGVLQNMYDSLWARTSDGTVVPGLCVSYERPDDVTWILHLQSGVKFHNGNDFGADDVKFSLERLRDWEGSHFQTMGGNIAEVEVLDELTVRLVTRAPWAMMPGTLYDIAMMDKTWTEAHDDEYVALNPMGTGPYKFVEWIPEDHLTMTENEEYWGEKASIETVVFYPIVDSSTRIAALLTGEVDLIRQVPPESAVLVEQDPGLQLISVPTGRVMHLGFNHLKPYFADIRVRQALTMAIDKAAIARQLYGDFAAPFDQIQALGWTGYMPEYQGVGYDPEKAKELLAAAGYAEGLTVLLQAPSDRDPHDAEVALAVTSMWLKIGVTAVLEARPKSLHFPEIVAKEIEDMYLMGWQDLSLDMARTFAKHFGTFEAEEGWGQWNGGNYSNQVIDDLIRGNEYILDLVEREQSLQYIHQLLLDEFACIPILTLSTGYGVVNGLLFTPRVTTFIIAKDIAWE